MNKKLLHAKRNMARVLRPRAHWYVVPAAFFATMLALPVNAGVVIPKDPLASGVRVAPNILFILDDSGSMAWANINNGSIANITGTGGFTSSPDANGVGSGTGIGSESTGKTDMYMQNYVTNTLYYDPSVDYEPWMDFDGNRVTGGTGYTTVYDADKYVTHTGAGTNGGSKNLSLKMQTFYVPRNPSSTNTTYLSTADNYYRYQIVSGGGDVVRAVYGRVTSTSGAVTVSPASGSVAGTATNTHTITSVPAGSKLTVKFTSPSSSKTVLFYLKNPGGGEECNKSINAGDSDTCTVNSTDSGNYKVEVKRWSSKADAATYNLSATYSSTNSCDGESDGTYGWINCTSALPTTRDLDAEKVNFATWYSYYRTRTKAAKGGAAEAFNPLNRKVRVGFRTIWERSTFDIPVGDGNDGRFVNGKLSEGDAAVTTSRSKWFNRLFAADASSGTPLQDALNKAGLYYSSKDSSGALLADGDGPYGPEKGTAQLSCRQNFSILTTDGFWNTGVVATAGGGDDTNGTTVTNGLLATDPKYKTFTYTKATPYKDGFTNTLADVAMNYWKNDLRTDLKNDVPSSYPDASIGSDPAFWQHMVTFTISIGLKTTNGLSSVSDVTSSTTWPDPQPGSCTSRSCPDVAARLDDLLHAAVNGRGSFVSAASPQSFSDGLAAALAKINERSASFSNASASDSTSLKAGSKIFKASYISGRWTGLLQAQDAVDGSKVWASTDAGVFPSYTSRKVFTRSGALTGFVGSNGVNGGTTFPDTTNQLPVLERTGGPAKYAVTAVNNANYIKGDSTNEGSSPGKLRVRSTPMGDIVDSSPAYVSETDTVYIGANDGMLHAFDATSGKELFAYVPNILNFGQLAALSKGDYEHLWFVDGPIAVSPTSLGPSGKNILVGTLGRGGKGLYALDVTTPASFGVDNVKWEMNETTGNNMGMVIGAPVLAKVRGGTIAAPALKPAVIFGNGPNSTNDKAVLVVLNMSNGSVIKEIATDTTTNNGLFAPTGVYAADGETLVYAYAGDMQGNVWKFDMTSQNPAAWTSKKVFHAEITTGKPQPITGGVALAVDPRTNQHWVFFGTGSFMTGDDANDKSAKAQSMYGVLDDGGNYTRTNLTERSVTSDPTTGRRYFGDLATLSGKGWFVDLPDVGERIVQNAQIDGSFLITASMMPSGNSCEEAAGSGYINAISPFAGMASGRSYFDLNNDGNTDDTGTLSNPTGSVKTVGMPTLPLLMPGLIRGLTSAGDDYNYGKGRPAWNRVSWRELRQD